MSTETEKRLAAQIAGIKDEVDDFMAGLDGALLAGKSIEALHDEIMERIALYDTPEAVDLFMQMTKGRSGVEIPELVKEVIQAPEGSEAKIIFTVETKDHNPGKSLVGHLGLALFEFNQDQVSCSNLEPRNPAELTDNQKACIGRAKEIPYVASNGFKVRWYNAAAIAEVMGNTKASNPLSGKYISANATVIDAYQLPLRKDVIANEFVEWAREHGVKWSTESPDALQVYRGYGDLMMDAFPGEWIAKCNKGAVHVFEPEVFATLYTSAAELLGVAHDIRRS